MDTICKLLKMCKKFEKPRFSYCKHGNLRPDRKGPHENRVSIAKSTTTQTHVFREYLRENEKFRKTVQEAAGNNLCPHHVT